jgi:hypothetical protein
MNDSIEGASLNPNTAVESWPCLTHELKATTPAQERPAARAAEECFHFIEQAGSLR